MHTTRNRGNAVDLLAGERLDQFLPELPHLDAFAGQVFMLKGYRGHTPFLDWRIQAEQQVGGGEVKEMQRMGLKYLCVVQQAANPGRCRVPDLPGPRHRSDRWPWPRPDDD